MIDKKGWTDPLDFYENTLVHENYLKRIRDNESNKMESGTIMAICVGLGLRRDLRRSVSEIGAQTTSISRSGSYLAENY